MQSQKYITNAELLALTRKAFENDEVPELLCGEKGYCVEGDMYTPSNIPTDILRVVYSGIYALYEEKKDPEIIHKFRQAILALNDTPEHIWCAYEACSTQIYYEQDSDYFTPFKMIDEPLLQTLRAAVFQNEAALRSSKEWLGINKENGLWDDITSHDNRLAQQFGVHVL